MPVALLLRHENTAPRTKINTKSHKKVAAEKAQLKRQSNLQMSGMGVGGARLATNPVPGDFSLIQ